jgi:hypothetical protein
VYFSESLQEARDAVAGFLSRLLGKNLGLNVNCFTRAMNAGNYAACG